MSKNRIIHFEGGPPQPNRPIQMEDLLNSAQEDWKNKRKDEAFIKVLGAISMISQGTAQAMKAADAALAIVEAIDPRVPQKPKQSEGEPPYIGDNPPPTIT